MINNILTVTLNPALDKTILVKNFGQDKENYLLKESYSAGGKGFNVSRTLKQFGLTTYSLSLIGGHNGAYLKYLLKKENIKGKYIKINENTRVNYTIIDTYSLLKTRILQKGPRVEVSEINELKRRYKKLLIKSSFVVLSGRNANCSNHSLYSDFIKIAKKHNLPVFLDTSGKPLKLAIKARPTIIKPNISEAEDILKCKLNNIYKIKKGISRLHKMGAVIVVISMGKKGAVCSDKKEIWMAQPPDVKEKNYVGCGDAFIGGFISSYINKRDIRNALIVGVASGTVNVMNMIPGFIDKKQVKKILKKITFKKI